MKRISWLLWLLAFSMVYLSEAQYKFRRPQLPPPPPPRPPPRIIKKSWAPGSRIMPMGNSLYIGGKFQHPKPLNNLNYRLRRPSGLHSLSSIFNKLPSSYENSITAKLGSMNNYGTRIQHVLPIKELQPTVKIPQQYTFGYGPNIETVLTHKDNLDDDSGAIHTIPAPNLGPASLIYQQTLQNQQNKDTKEDEVRKSHLISQVEHKNVFDGTEQTNIQHQYEVTESNEVNSVASTYFAPDRFDTMQYSPSDVQQPKANKDNIYLSDQVSVMGSLPNSHSSEIEPSSSVYANSMFVTLPKFGNKIEQQTQFSNLHVDEPAINQSVASNVNFYEALKTFPRQLTDHYIFAQQPKTQQHLQQQQVKQMFDQQDGQSDSLKIQFSQPMIHSFNYEEVNPDREDNQQNIFIDQNYASEKVTADYRFFPETSHINNVNISKRIESIEPNNSTDVIRSTFLQNQLEDDHQSKVTQFYTTLPNRETAEKLAALAAAGNVNSQLIDKLKRQQQEKDNSLLQNLYPYSLQQAIPSNHKEESRSNDPISSIGQRAENYRKQQEQAKPIQKFSHHHKAITEEQIKSEEDKKNLREENTKEEKQPLRIFVVEGDKGKEITTNDYEYENDEEQVSRINDSSLEHLEFGSHILSDTRK